MKRCLYCGEGTHQGLQIRFTIDTSTGQCAVDVVVCVDCSHTRRVTLGEVLALARARN